MSSPAPSKREGYHHGDVRATALTAGLAMLEQGDEVTVRSVARTIGVAHRAIALQFGDKAGFEAALAAIGFDRLASAVATAGDSGAFLRAYLDFGLSQPHLYDLMMRQSYQAFETHPALRAAADRMIGSALARLASPTEDVQSRRRAVMRLWMMAHGGLGLHRAGVLMRRTDAVFVEELLSVAGVGGEDAPSPDQSLWNPSGSLTDV